MAAAGISAVRRTKKSDNNRISRASGATIVNDTGDLKEEDVGTGCGLFEVRKIGDEYDPIKFHLNRFYITFI